MEKFCVTYLEANNRLDKALSLFKSELSRSYIAKLIDEGKVLVNDKLEKASFKVKENDEITLLTIDEKVSEIAKEDIPLDILYEDDDIILIDKPAGILSQKADQNDISINELITGYMLAEGKTDEQALRTFKPSICIHHAGGDHKGLAEGSGVYPTNG